ncbi:branched-chain amino acid ABC transporter permease [Roseomonas nepalensis]|uniref:Branched-chain amino acid ABC transporter permease n=1 Tax=Muricoccus nepalensis TaxID=1854500 RepID=A0A502FVZ8_9PROT|nr:branched-chain amino acid ABC transporter permease [Roseomonas nepalensis]TPG53827.1 branched-chain amino acid ABC transporter permease [Roseomonas nepalensis]
MLELVPQLLFTGLGIGAIYALVALGFVLLIRAANVVNFAQGEFSMLGAYMMVVLLSILGLPYFVAIPLAVVGMAAFGILFAGATYWPLRHRGQLPVIISTIGASIFLSNIVLATYGPSPEVLPGLFDSPGLEIGGVFMDSQYLAIIVITALLVLLQFLIFEKTLLGKKLQATSQDKEMASLLGIPVAVMVLITFGYSAALGGIAGVLVAPILFVSVGMGALISLKAFAANIIGGFGNIPGAILGGLALGVVETFGAAFISVPYKDAIAFALLLLFLLIRPQGLFGEKISEKA